LQIPHRVTPFMRAGCRKLGKGTKMLNQGAQRAQPLYT
jgi:hypothetical protein